MQWPWRNGIKNKESGEVLMVRYYLSPKIFTLRLVVHKFLKSDERVFHDHPWNYVSLILKGGYLEYTPHGSSYKFEHQVPGDLIRRKATFQHYVRLYDEKPAWSLVLFWGKRREWGFYTEKGWVHHSEYET